MLRDLAETRNTLAESRARARRPTVAPRARQLHVPRPPDAAFGLRALSEGLEDGVVTDVPRALTHLRATVARMSVLVDDLFALSRVQDPREPNLKRWCR